MPSLKSKSIVPWQSGSTGSRLRTPVSSPPMKRSPSQFVMVWGLSPMLFMKAMPLPTRSHSLPLQRARPSEESPTRTPPAKRPSTPWCAQRAPSRLPMGSFQPPTPSRVRSHSSVTTSTEVP